MVYNKDKGKVGLFFNHFIVMNYIYNDIDWHKK
jgi:hypothetical protein